MPNAEVYGDHRGPAVRMAKMEFDAVDASLVVTELASTLGPTARVAKTVVAASSAPRQPEDRDGLSGAFGFSTSSRESDSIGRTRRRRRVRRRHNCLVVSHVSLIWCTWYTMSEAHRRAPPYRLSRRVDSRRQPLAPRLAGVAGGTGLRGQRVRVFPDRAPLAGPHPRAQS